MDPSNHSQGVKNYSFFQLLKTSIKYQFKEFFNNSNLHGVKYIAEKGRPFHEKFIWTCCVSIGLANTLIIVTSLWEKFQTNPTITGLDTDFYKWDVLFPAITVCPRYSADENAVENFITSQWGETIEEEKRNYYKKFVTQVTNFSIHNMEGILEFEEDKSLSNLNLKDIMRKTVIECENMLEDCTWKGERYECCDMFYPVLTDKGFCYTFNSKHFERNFSGLIIDSDVQSIELKYIYETDYELSLIFNSPIVDKNPLTVYIHSSTDRIGLEFQAYHVWTRKVDKILFSSKETYTNEDARQLSIQQRRCVFPDEIPLTTNDIYTFNACMTQCRMIVANEKCGCIPFFYPEIDIYKSCSINELACIARIGDEISKGFDCDCELGCKNMVYEIEKLEDHRIDEPNTPLEVGFLSWPLVRYKREVFFGWVDLFVAVGGIAGLFMGFSVLTIVEIIYFFTLRACCMVYKEKDELSRLYEEYENADKAKIKLDLNPFSISENDEEEKIDFNNVQNNETVIYPYLP